MAPTPGLPLAKKINAPEQYAEKIARIPYDFFKSQQCIHWKKETGCEVEVKLHGRTPLFLLYGSKESVKRLQKPSTNG